MHSLVAVAQVLLDSDGNAVEVRKGANGDRIYLQEGTYDECLEWLLNNFSEDLELISLETGRLLSWAGWIKN